MKNRRELFRYAQLLLGSAILAFGLFNVHSQSRITEGGVLGKQRRLCSIGSAFPLPFPKRRWMYAAICWA